MFAANQIRLTNLLRLIKETPDFMYEVMKALSWKNLQYIQKGCLSRICLF